MNVKSTSFTDVSMILKKIKLLKTPSLARIEKGLSDFEKPWMLHNVSI